MFQLTIHGFGGDKHIIDICTDESSFCKMTITDVKNKFVKETGMPVEPETIRFLFAGKQLENQMTLSYYNIQNKSVIMTVVRLPGGF
jgi:hypothetical protein